MTGNSARGARHLLSINIIQALFSFPFSVHYRIPPLALHPFGSASSVADVNVSVTAKILFPTKQAGPMPSSQNATCICTNALFPFCSITGSNIPARHRKAAAMDPPNTLELDVCNVPTYQSVRNLDAFWLHQRLLRSIGAPDSCIGTVSNKKSIPLEHLDSAIY